MQTRNVHDTKGKWLVNLAKFSFVDPESGCRFDPNIPTQAKVTAWVKSQDAVIKPWIDPTEANEAAEAEAARVAAEAEAARVAAEAEAARVAAEAANKKSK